MNTVQLIGRPTRDPEVRYSQGECSPGCCPLYFGGQPRGKKGQ